MKINVEDITETRKKITVSVPADKVTATDDQITGQFLKQARLPGFRPGKAPKDRVRKQFAKRIEEEVNKRVGQEALDTVQKESGLKLYRLLKVDGGQFKHGEDGEISFEADINPDFELPDYKGVAVTVLREEATDEDVSSALDSLRRERSEFNPVERAAEKGDYVKLSYEGKAGEEAGADLVPDQPIYGKQASTWEEAGAEEAPGVRAVIDGIVGLKAGDTKTVEETFPADHPVEALQGKTVNYAIEVQEVRERILPDINEDFLKSLQVESEEQLRERLRDDIISQIHQNNERMKREQAIGSIAAQLDFPIPESAVEHEAQVMLANHMARQMQQGVPQEQFEEMKDELHRQATEAARGRVKMQLILARIAEKEEIKVENEDVQHHIQQEAMARRERPEKVIKDLQKNQARLVEIQRGILYNKALEFIVEQATVNEAESPAAPTGAAASTP